VPGYSPPSRFPLPLGLSSPISKIFSSPEAPRRESFSSELFLFYVGISSIVVSLVEKRREESRLNTGALFQLDHASGRSDIEFSERAGDSMEFRRTFYPAPYRGYNHIGFPYERGVQKSLPCKDSFFRLTGTRYILPPGLLSLFRVLHLRAKVQCPLRISRRTRYLSWLRLFGSLFPCFFLGWTFFCSPPLFSPFLFARPARESPRSGVLFSTSVFLFCEY